MNKKKDIIFLSLPRLELRSPITAPAILKAQVEKHGYTALCIDLNLQLWHALDSSTFGHMWFDTDLTFRHEEKFDQFWEETLKEHAIKWLNSIREHSPRWVGITIFSQRSKWITIKLCELIRKELKKVKIVTGGSFSERVSPTLLKKGLIDAYVIGEGELPILNILKGNLDSPGINGRPPVQIENLDEIPIPDYSDFAFDQYPKQWNDPRIKDLSNLGSEFVYITGSRGCVRKCDFCDVQSLWPKFRFRSGEQIAEEMMIQNTKYGSRRFLFTDSLINGSVKQLKDLCTTLIRYRQEGKMEKVLWQGQFIARPEAHMGDDIYKLMKDAGCFFVSIGVESGSELVRNDMKKHFDDKALDYTFKACARNGIEMAWLLLVGYPTETEAEFQKTLDLLEKYNWINQEGLVRSVALGPTLDIVPGSPLHNRHKEMGITWDDHNNWVYNENNRVIRIKRWLRLKSKCKELNYPIVEKATEHLLMELDSYSDSKVTTESKVYDHFNENFGSMDRDK